MTSDLTREEQLAMDNIVHTPSETAASYVRFAKEIQLYPGVKWGCSLDEHLLPLRPGRAIGLLARPGHGKTTLGGYLIANEARRIVAQGRQDTHYAAHISWEQSVEELDSMYQMTDQYGVTDVAWGRVPIEQVIGDSFKRPQLPVWIFGDSLYKSTLDTPPMTVESVYHGIQAIHKHHGMLPSLLFFDYIQDIPVPSERDRYMQVSSAMRLVKRLAIQIQCPIVLGVQANARTDDRDKRKQIPTMRDTEWSAVIGQKLDALLALWRPIRTLSPHDDPLVNIGGQEYEVSENLFVVKLLKQRFEKGHGIWAYSFNPSTMQLLEYERHDLVPF